jgi:hypothetical protein
MLPCATVALAACGAQSTHQLANDGSRYAAPCAVAGVDEVPAPVQSRGDSLALVARYRFGGETPGGHALPLRVELARPSKDDPQLQLEAHARVVCNPDSEPGTSGMAAVEDGSR